MDRLQVHRELIRPDRALDSDQRGISLSADQVLSDRSRKIATIEAKHRGHQTPRLGHFRGRRPSQARCGRTAGMFVYAINGSAGSTSAWTPALKAT
ncbi:hypothetical protein L3067_09615 [Xanthomonas sp. PPL568]|uniref:hypothetical protein n=1 Tax=Xanthomonas TaxID=338 RepID=UPI00136924AB|nr:MULTISPECIES: hypothetical protein [Xanthomonas]MBB6365020.1 hypothetical protein [Xanthomonas sp. F10]MCI2244856.1 hypothetical protein [Xanthomonas indica]